MDLISQLPESLIHHILTFLPTTDATRTCVLSKRFRSAWSSFPLINFDEDLFGGKLGRTLVSRERMMFLNCAYNSIQRREENVGVQKFRLRISPCDGEIFSDRLNGLLQFAMNNCVNEVDLHIVSDKGFDFFEYLGPHFPYQLDFRIGRSSYDTLPRANSAAKSMTVLKLNGFRFDFDDLILSCPLIEDLSLNSCDVSRKIKLSSAKLRRLELERCSELQSIEIEALNLQSFAFVGVSKACEINVDACKSLRELTLGAATITDDWFEDKIRKFLELETLKLSTCNVLRNINLSSKKLKIVDMRYCRNLENVKIDVLFLESFLYYGSINGCRINIAACRFLRSLTLRHPTIRDEWLKENLPMFVVLEDLTLNGCDMLKRIEIFNEHLENFCLLDCTGLDEAEIDTPKLRSFTFSGSLVFFDYLNSTGLLNATLFLQFPPQYRPPASEHQFRWLRNFLGLFDHCNAVTLVCPSDKDLIFPEELRRNSLPPLYDLKHLKIKIDSLSTSYTKLVDGVLWFAPRPETLTIVTNKKEKFIKFQYKNMKVVNEDDSSCCKDHPIKCWRHYLKKVTLENFGHTRKEEGLLKFFAENAKKNLDMYIGNQDDISLLF